MPGSEVENESMCSFNLVKAPTFIITNKLVLELNDYREKKGQTWSTLLSWLLSFTKETNKETSVFAFHWVVDKIVEQKTGPNCRMNNKNKLRTEITRRY